MRSLLARIRKILVAWSQRNTLPGFQGISVYDVVKFLIQEMKDFDLIVRAQSMAFSFFLALFPAIIFLFTLVPYLPIENFDLTLQRAIESFLPESAHNFIFESVQQIRSRQRDGLLSFGFVLSLFFASNGMLSMIRGFHKAHLESYKKRNFVQKRLVAIWLTVLFGILLVVAIFSISFGRQLIIYLLDLADHRDWQLYVLLALKWILVFMIFYTIMSLVYRFGPALKNKLNFFTPGATLATILGILLSILFSYVMDNFGNQSQIYGSLGAIIVTMLWIQVNCFIILVGYELNASIAVNRDIAASSKGAPSSPIPPTSS